MNDLLTYIGLMKRASCLSIGAEDAFSICREGKARILLLASDAADNITKNAGHFSKSNKTPVKKTPFTKLDLGAALGQKECSALAITDTGFALSFCKRMQYSEEIDSLQERLAREKKRLAKKTKSTPDKRQLRGKINGR